MGKDRGSFLPCKVQETLQALLRKINDLFISNYILYFDQLTLPRISDTYRLQVLKAH
jgi:hypothetical protein